MSKRLFCLGVVNSAFLASLVCSPCLGQSPGESAAGKPADAQQDQQAEKQEKQAQKQQKQAQKKEEEKQELEAQQPKAGEASRSTLEVKPGKPAIKTEELIQQKKISPWAHFPRHLLSDQKSIWTSPFHTSKKDLKWWGIFGGATGVLIATDKWTSSQLPNTKDQVKVANITSRIGAAYTLVPATAATYFVGTFSHNDRLRETGILGFESLINTFIVVNVFKTATQRQRPTEGDGKGNFFQGTGRLWNEGASFPSGHAIHTWALASLLAHEYPHPRWVPIAGYTLAMTVVGSRFAARKHFASDVVAGSAMGWFIGDFVYGKRHNRALDEAPRSKLQQILAHIEIGGGSPLPMR